MTNMTQLSADFVRQIDQTYAWFENRSYYSINYEQLELLKEFFTDKVGHHISAFLSVYTRWQLNSPNLSQEQFLRMGDGWYSLLKQPDINNLSYLDDLGFKMTHIDNQDYINFRHKLCSQWIKSLSEHNLFDTPRIQSSTRRHDSIGSSSSFYPPYFDLNRRSSDLTSVSPSSPSARSRRYSAN